MNFGGLARFSLSPCNPPKKSPPPEGWRAATGVAKRRGGPFLFSARTTHVPPPRLAALAPPERGFSRFSDTHHTAPSGVGARCSCNLSPITYNEDGHHPGRPLPAARYW